MRTEKAQKRLSARQKANEDNKADVAFYEEVMRAGRHGDCNAMLDLLCNPPPNVSEAVREEIERFSHLLSRLANLYNEVEVRSEVDGLDLEEMLTPEFLTGQEGWRASQDRINRSLAFMDEMERRFFALRAEMKSMKSPEASKYFNADKQ